MTVVPKELRLTGELSISDALACVSNRELQAASPLIVRNY